MTIFYYNSLDSPDNFSKSKEYAAFTKDLLTTWQKARAEVFWRARYRQRADFNGTPEASPGKIKASGSGPAVVLLEGYSVSPEVEEKYQTWFARWGYQVYLPLIMKLPGLKRCVQYEFTPINITDGVAPIRSVEYPQYLNILTFDDLDSFEKYEKSLELSAFKGALQALLPVGLEHKWYVQYQLMKSWRK